MLPRVSAAMALHAIGFAAQAKQASRRHGADAVGGVFPYSFVQPKENAQGHAGGSAAGVFPYILLLLLIHRVQLMRSLENTMFSRLFYML